MSDASTGEKTTSELVRDRMLKAYLEKEEAKSAEMKKQKNPSAKQQFMKELRGMVEKF